MSILSIYSASKNDLKREGAKAKAMEYMIFSSETIFFSFSSTWLAYFKRSVKRVVPSMD